MQPSAPTRPRTSHLDLAQRILDLARQRGLAAGERLPEQKIASLCKVSRTPVRAALRLLAEKGVVRHEPDAGYRLVVDAGSPATIAPDMPSSAESDLAEAILRDRSARRLDETVTVSGLARRYAKPRKMVLKALEILAAETLVDRAPGQSWLFRPATDGPDAQAESYDYRLLLEPAAILEPGFRLDGARASALRQATETLAGMRDESFDIRDFQRLDADFHELVAAGCGNRFLAEALARHLRLKRRPGAPGVASIFRLRQSAREHLAILDQLESRQYEVAADLMRVHLRLSRNQRPQAASRGFGALRRAQGA